MAKRELVTYIDEGNSINVICYSQDNVMNMLLMETHKTFHILIKIYNYHNEPDIITILAL